jgi:hypothetical protein
VVASRSLRDVDGKMGVGQAFSTATTCKSQPAGRFQPAVRFKLPPSRNQLMKTHAIQWKCTVNGTVGTGTKRFTKEVAERLAAELNESYPEIIHEAVIPPPPAAEPAAVEPLNPS